HFGRHECLCFTVPPASSQTPTTWCQWLSAAAKALVAPEVFPAALRTKNRKSPPAPESSTNCSPPPPEPSPTMQLPPFLYSISMIQASTENSALPPLVVPKFNKVGTLCTRLLVGLC